MSYEQKYLKYKQKYKNLQKEYNSKMEEVKMDKKATLVGKKATLVDETATLVDETATLDNFELTDTPGKLPSMRGGAIDDFILSDTPTYEMKGGDATTSAITFNTPGPGATMAAPVVGAPDYCMNMPVATTASTTTSVALRSMNGGAAPFVPMGNVPCPGIVNPQPNTSVPLPLTGGSAPFVPMASNTPCPGIVNAQPNTTVPLPINLQTLTGGEKTTMTDTLIETTTNLSEASKVSAKESAKEMSDIRNTADIEQLFKQLGGKKKHHKSEISSSSSSSSSDSASSSSIMSDLDEIISVNDI